MSTSVLYFDQRLVPWVVGILVTAAIFLSLSHSRCSRRRLRLPLPPGPTPLPVIGNLLDVPTTNLGANFWKISEKYGAIAYLSVLGQPMIVLGSYDIACTLLEHRSATTSDRQSLKMADLTGYSPWEFTLFGYGQAWRRHRRAFHTHFHRGAVARYQPVQLQQTQRFLQRLLDQPHDFVSHIRQFFGATIMRIVYGIEVAEKNDRFITLAERGVEIFITMMIPGRYLVEAFPALRYVPSWFPGARFRREAAQWKKEVQAMCDEPFNVVVEEFEMEKGSTAPSVVASMLQETVRMSGDAAREQKELTKNIGAISYLTGADTTFSSVQAFFLAMAMYPDVQKTAQAELDAVIGPDRLPDFSDRASLPYVNAIVKEVFRWQNIAPLGVPHVTTEDEELNGYFIPKGAVIVPNIWAMSRDLVTYPDPDEFQPERFMLNGAVNPAARDPQQYAFGFGRRICPGRHFADSSLFIIVASMLQTLNIEPPVDNEGQPVRVERKIATDLFVSYPMPFDCKITPRSSLAKDLILGDERASARS